MRREEATLIGERLRLARQRAGCTQEEASREVNVGRPTISNWEAGRNLPDLVQFRSLVALYGASPSWVLFGTPRVALSPDERAELTEAARGLSEGLQRRIDVLLLLLALEA